eukprot:1159947-Pelagomonas_calceolata.AAC.3
MPASVKGQITLRNVMLDSCINCIVPPAMHYKPCMLSTKAKSCDVSLQSDHMHPSAERFKLSFDSWEPSSKWVQARFKGKMEKAISIEGE